MYFYDGTNCYLGDRDSSPTVGYAGLPVTSLNKFELQGTIDARLKTTLH